MESRVLHHISMDSFLSSDSSVKPFLKWVGGKTQLLEEIKANLPDPEAAVRERGEYLAGRAFQAFKVI